MTVVTRFAPSPTGRLHIGHAHSALFARKQAQDAGGKFILRIEDIDADRCRPEFEQGIYEDLEWLGLTWETPVRRQSEHIADYKAALDKLQAQGLLYPCFCTRKDIADEIARAGVAPHGPEGQLYPGICRVLGESVRADKIAAGLPYAWRLDMQKATLSLDPSPPGRGKGGAQAPTGRGPLQWHDRAKGWQTATPEILGDVVLARKDIGTSYHLSVTVDDHLQGVNLVTRGEDLFYATHLHRLLQELLSLDVPEWHHHKLLLDHEGKRFAKRNNAVTLQHMREVEKKTPEQVRAMAGF
jgi:glutamyl-Q tRNA(Asp) synthetase